MNGLSQIGSSFSGTPGAGNTIENVLQIVIPDNFIGIHSFHAFQEKYRKKNGDINGNYVGIEKKLLQIRAITETKYNNNIDPVEYLYFLYYVEEIDLEGILQRLNGCCPEGESIYPHKSGLSNLMNNVLGWKLRTKHCQTPLSKKKYSQRYSPISELNSSRQAQAKKQVQDILENIAHSSFSISIFNEKRNKKDKLIYVFYSLGIINEESYTAFKDKLSELKNKGFGTDRITNIIIGIIKYQGIEMKLHSKEVWKFLQ